MVKGFGSSVRVIHVAPYHEASYFPADIFDRNLDLMRSWEWVFASTPTFRLRLKDFLVSHANEVCDGLIVICERGEFKRLEIESSSEAGTEASLETWLASLSEALCKSPCQLDAWVHPLDQFIRASSAPLSNLQMAIIASLKAISAKF
ncbi:unnamed protein product [Protopolystoma xenopodis]|uniref:Uncharacterized protein n=1 Tax=Protopolystoma xenopodis TaxID=117903 RepID=A0A3S5AYK2_9PLAT|nr:unnamed protein product [Protopolystoma xenopodis]VEL29930.1 unnamed protein product [Protopolystoma xenopodis]